jgi:hypothetical protein
MLSSGLWHSLALVSTNVVQEHTISIIRVRRIRRIFSPRWWRWHVSTKHRFLQQPHNTTSQKTKFFSNICSKCYHYNNLHAAIMGSFRICMVYLQLGKGNTLYSHQLISLWILQEKAQIKFHIASHIKVISSFLSIRPIVKKCYYNIPFPHLQIVRNPASNATRRDPMKLWFFCPQP